MGYLLKSLLEKEKGLNIMEQKEINTKKIQKFIDENKDSIYIGKINDGDHSFDDLYYHRMVLFSIICNQNKDIAWKSLLHDDGKMFDDYFIVGITTPEGSYTYHYQINYWDNFDVNVLEKAPKWDGHKPEDVTRLYSILNK